MTRCVMCRERFAICEPTVEVEDGAELCLRCDAGFPEPLRPSLGGAVAFLNRAPDLYFSRPHEFGTVSMAPHGPMFGEV